MSSPHCETTWRVDHADVLDGVAALPPRSVQTVVTSPPYWGHRDYGAPPTRWPAVEYSPLPGLPRYHCDAEESVLGLEVRPETYVGHLVLVARALRGVLREDGTLWLNIGDTYRTGSGWGDRTPKPGGGRQGARALERMNAAHRGPGKGCRPSRRADDAAVIPWAAPNRGPHPHIKLKDMCGIPWRVALALQADGWYLRRAIVWAKPNPTPESPLDRPMQSHELILLLSVRDKYFYDPYAPREEGAEDRMLTRDVWTFASRPRSPGNGDVEHFAAFPEELPRACIRLGSPESTCAACGAARRRITTRRRVYEGDETARADRRRRQATLIAPPPKLVPDVEDRRYRVVVKTTGWLPTCDCGAGDAPAVVLDPFCGSGTTGEVAVALRRSFVGIDLVEANVGLATERIAAAAHRVAEGRRQLSLFAGGHR